jgi:hypothetical protein
MPRGLVVQYLAGWVEGEHFHVTPAAFKQHFASEMGVDRAARGLLDAGYLTVGGASKDHCRTRC